MIEQVIEKIILLGRFIDFLKGPWEKNMILKKMLVMAVSMILVLTQAADVVLSKEELSTEKEETSRTALLTVADSVQVEPFLAEEARQCFSLDVVILMDQSSSMGGEPGIPPNDPLGNRKYAAQAMIDQLADIALDNCPETRHRIGVISYGTEARVDLPLSDIDVDTYEEAQLVRQRLSNNLKIDSLGKTDPAQAFYLAKQMLDEAEILTDGPRKRVIIYVTDGHPCVSSWGCNPPVANTMDYVSYMRTLKAWSFENLAFNEALLNRETCLASLADEHGSYKDIPSEEAAHCYDDYPVSDDEYRESTYVFALLIGHGSAYSQLLKDEINEMASSLGGRLEDLKQDGSDIPEKMEEILTQLAGVKVGRLQCGQFAVNPYLKRAIIVIHKNATDLTTRMWYEDDAGRHEISGETIVNGGFDLEEVNFYGPSERYTFRYPAPGLWHLEADDCQGITAYYQEATINVQGYSLGIDQVPQYDREPYADPHNSYFIDYQMIEEDGTLIDEADHSRFKVNFDLRVTRPGGEVQTPRVEWNAAQHKFTAVDPIQVPVPGTYQVDMVGTTFHHVGEPAPVGPSYQETFSEERELFRLENMTFEVFPVNPFHFEVLTPTDSEVLSPIHDSIQAGWPLPVRKIPVSVKIVGRDGQTINAPLSDVLVDPSNALAAVASLDGTNTTSGQIILQPDPAIPGVLRGEIAEFDAEGDLTLTVSLNDQGRSRTSIFRPEAYEAVVRFQRIDSPWGRASTYYTILAALIALILIIVIYNIAIRTNKVRGQLVFKDNTVDIATFSLSSGVNWKVIPARVLRSFPQIPLTQIRVVNAGKPAQRQQTSADVLIDDGGFDGMTGVIAQCSARGGRRYSVHLAPNIPTSFDDESSLTVEYIPYSQSTTEYE